MVQLVSAQYVCERWGITNRTLHELMKEGRVAYVDLRAGKGRPLLRFPKAWVDAMVDSQLARFQMDEAGAK